MPSYQGPNRRTETDLNKQLLGAVERIRNGGELRSTDSTGFKARVAEILKLEERREALLGAKLYTGLGFDKIEPVIEGQHEEAVDLLKRGNLTGGITVPGLQETMDILGENYTDVQIAEILKMQKAALIIEPKKPFVAYVAAIDANRREGQRRTFVSPYLQTRFTTMPSSNGVKVGFVEGFPELAGDRVLMGRKLRFQETFVKAGLPEGVGIVDPRADALLQLNGMQTGELVDRKYWSALEDGSTERSYLPVCAWDCGRVVFGVGNLEHGRRVVRWRREVMVEKN